MKKIMSLLLAFMMSSLFLCMGGCGNTKTYEKNNVPKGNISFDSIEEMQECLNGKWFSISGFHMSPMYTEIIFNNSEIKKCEVYGWIWRKVKGENGEEELVYELKHYDDLRFEKYADYKPNFKYKTGQVKFSEVRKNINIKEYVDIVEEEKVKEKYLLIGNSVFFKATDKIEFSCDNFKIFEKFCEIALPNKFSNPFTSMNYNYDDEEIGIEEGIADDEFYIYEGCDTDEISFEVSRGIVHYFARRDEFDYLYDEIKHLFLRRTNIIGLMGTEMSNFEKPSWANKHIFKELQYYLYMNSEGELISNVSFADNS